MDIKQLEKGKISMKSRTKSKNRYNNVVYIIIFLFCGSYAFFFTTKLWVNDTKSLVQATKINSPKTWDDRNIKLLSWNYSKLQNEMEIQLTIENQSLDGINDYIFTAIDKNKGYLDTEVIVNTDGFYVIRIEDIPYRWSQISLRINLSEEDDTTCKLYTNRVDVAQVDKIEDLTYNEYMIARLDGLILTYSDEITKLKDDIEEQNNIINNCNDNISTYKENEEFQTELEKKETERLISELQMQISNSKSNIETDNTNIAEYQERIELINKQKTTYE